MGTILNDDTVAGIVALSERNPGDDCGGNVVVLYQTVNPMVNMLTMITWVTGEQDHQQAPLAPATNVSRTALRTGAVSRLLSESPVQASQLASGTLQQRRTILLSTLKKSAVKHLAGFDKTSELTALIQTAANSQQKTLEVLFAEPELLQSLWQRHG